MHAHIMTRNTHRPGGVKDYIIPQIEAEDEETFRLFVIGAVINPRPQGRQEIEMEGDMVDVQEWDEEGQWIQATTASWCDADTCDMSKAVKRDG